MGWRGTAHLVEIDPSGLRWAKSSASTGGSGGSNCVEIAVVSDIAQLRCSRNRQPRLRVPQQALAMLLRHVSER